MCWPTRAKSLLFKTPHTPHPVCPWEGCERRQGGEGWGPSFWREVVQHVVRTFPPGTFQSNKLHSPASTGCWLPLNCPPSVSVTAFHCTFYSSRILYQATSFLIFWNQQIFFVNCGQNLMKSQSILFVVCKNELRISTWPPDCIFMRNQCSLATKSNIIK